MNLSFFFFSCLASPMLRSSKALSEKRFDPAGAKERSARRSPKNKGCGNESPLKAFANKESRRERFLRMVRSGPKVLLCTRQKRRPSCSFPGILPAWNEAPFFIIYFGSVSGFKFFGLIPEACPNLWRIGRVPPLFKWT